jgi:hypothetical protein
LFSRPLWLDEIHTLLVAGYGDLGSSMRSLAAGSDFNPPTLFLVYRLLGWLCGGLTEIPMRIVAAVSVTAALALVYRLLRDDFGRIPAAVGTLALWAQPIVTAVAFDARFYGPWLFGIAALLVALRRTIDRPPTLATSALLASTSVLVCTIHYFGIVSWGGALATAAVVARRRRVHVARSLASALAGPVALGACTPLYLGQRSALSIPTWIPRASVADHAFLLSVILLPLTTIVALAGWAITRGLAPLAPQRAVDPASAPPETVGTSSVLLVSQAVVPVVLALFSLFIQPATQPRYWIAGSLAAAPIVAFAVSRTAVVLRIVVAGLILLASVKTVRDEATSARDRQRMADEDAAATERATAEGTIIVLRRRHTLYPLVRAIPSLKNRAVLLDGTGTASDTGADAQLLIVDRDVARVHERFYGFPQLVTPAQLAKIPFFYFLELDPTRIPSPTEVPGHTVERVGPRLFRVRR